MRLNQNPIFRKVIVPWYDSETVCVITAICMLMTMGFGLVGISVARETPSYHPHIWIPATLFILSLAVFISTMIRLIPRLRGRKPE